jgi:hypothetical protein
MNAAFTINGNRAAFSNLTIGVRRGLNDFSTVSFEQRPFVRVDKKNRLKDALSFLWEHRFRSPCQAPTASRTEEYRVVLYAAKG